MAGSYRSDATAGQTSGIRETVRPQTVLAVEARSTPSRYATREGCWRSRSVRRSGPVTRESPHDPQTVFRGIPPLLAQDRSQDRQAPQPRYLQEPRYGGEAREGGAILQTPLIDAQTRIALGLPS